MKIHTTIQFHIEDGGLAAEAIVYNNVPVKFKRTMARTISHAGGGWAYLHRIWVRKRNRGKGVGSALMVQLCALADNTRTALILNVLPFDAKGLTRAMLRAFYAAYGFRSAGRNVMVRLPQTRQCVITIP